MIAQPIYSDENIVITASIATFFGTSYPISVIKAFKATEIKKGKWHRLFLWFFGLPFTLFSGLYFSVSLFLAVKDRRRGFPLDTVLNMYSSFLTLLAALFIFGVFMIMRAVQSRSMPADYALIITTDAGEKTVAVSKSSAYIEHIRAAIAEAIEMRQT